MKFLKIIATFALVVVVVGCGGGNHENPEIYHAPNGDLRESSASVTNPPVFLDGQPDIIRKAYMLAAQHVDLLEWIPCYCGCGESAGHRSSKHCFVHEVKEDGTVVWDDHGTRCGVCIQIAVESIAMYKQGFTVKQIRDAIDQAYGTGLGAPTPTPMPSA